MNEELLALAKTQAWDMFDLTTGKTIVGCKWIYKIKTRANGSMEQYKTWLMGKGLLKSLVLTVRRLLLS